MTVWIRHRYFSWILLILAGTLVPDAWAQRTQLKPGINLFSTAQDVEMGRQVSADAEKQLPMLNDRRVDDYLSTLGKNLAANAPGEDFPYQFKAVNDAAINAFALPGGFLYVNRGTIEAADNEAQLAGVVAHEIAHAALRHGTNQASKAYIAKMPLALLGGFGRQSVAGVLAQIGGGFAANSVLLKYSREAERQADLMGTQILFDTGYDPRAMMQFFEKLDARGGSGLPQWLSSHPNTSNRISDINGEIDRLGGAPARAQTDSREFQSIRGYVKSLPQPKPASKEAASAKPQESTQPGVPKPDKPSQRLRAYDNDFLSLRYPENWQESGDDSLNLAPARGLVATKQGQSLAYGMFVGVFAPKAAKSGRFDLNDATDQLIANLKQSNTNVAVARAAAQTRVNGQRARSTMLRNDSALGGAETNWLVTVLRPEGLVYFVCVAPEKEYADYRRACENVIASVQFK